MTAIENTERLNQLRIRVFQIERLAAMPQVVWRLMDALGDERTDALRLERIIESDPAIVSKILSLANSAYYGLPQKITTVRRAVVIIGFQELQVLALGAGLAEVFDLRKVPLGFDGEALWLHCLAVSWAARELAEAARYPIPGEIMVAGLLHDLGKLILVTHLADEFSQVLRLAGQDTPYFQAEEQLGLNHTIIGYWLAARWGLPEIHSSAIRDHHHPQDTGPYCISTCLVALADQLVKELGLGLVQEAPPLDFSTALQAANLSPDRFQAVAESVKEKVPSMLETWKQTL